MLNVINMFDILMRNLKDKILEPFLALIPAYKFSPNYITLLSGVFGVLSFIACLNELRTLAFILWLLNRIVDGLDGAYA